MSDERCACGRFLALPGGMAQIEDGVYHVPSGAPACEVIALRDEVERLTRERDKERAVLAGLPCMFVWRDRREGSIRPACDQAGPYDDEPIPEHAWCPTCRARALLASRGAKERAP